MKRLKIKVEDDHVLRPYPALDITQEQYPDAKIAEDNNQSYVAYIQKMLDSATECYPVERNESVVYILQFMLSVGTCSATISKNSITGVWYNMCKYQLWKSGAVVAPVPKTICTPAEFCKMFLTPKPKYTVLCMGKKGEVKKPEVLKGVAKFASVSFEKMCQSQLYLNGQDLYIKQGDYFSPEYLDPDNGGMPLFFRLKKYGIPHSIKERRIYADSWGAIVLRRVAWIRITNFVFLLYHLNNVEIATTIWSMMRSYHHWGSIEQNEGWMRFLEDVADTTRKYLKIN